jgi:hypothetical protein
LPHRDHPNYYAAITAFESERREKRRLADEAKEAEVLRLRETARTLFRSTTTDFSPPTSSASSSRTSTIYSEDEAPIEPHYEPGLTGANDPFTQESIARTHSDSDIARLVQEYDEKFATATSSPSSPSFARPSNFHHFEPNGYDLADAEAERLDRLEAEFCNAEPTYDDYDADYVYFQNQDM